MARRLLPVLVLLSAALALAGCGDDAAAPQKTLAEVTPDMTGADPRLVELVDQAGELLPGEERAFNARLKELRGLPIVANKWASWCHPCAAESPAFQETAKKLGNRVAFLGVDVFDTTDGAEEFLTKHPMPYPSYVDKDTRISKQFPPAGSPPVTNFYDVKGRLVHSEAGEITTAARLQELIDRYIGPIPTNPGS